MFRSLRSTSSRITKHPKKAAAVHTSVRLDRHKQQEILSAGGAQTHVHSGARLRHAQQKQRRRVRVRRCQSARGSGISRRQVEEARASALAWLHQGPVKATAPVPSANLCLCAAVLICVLYLRQPAQ
eukprot:6208480-Pleurochrysis_carterae.AAC.2